MDKVLNVNLHGAPIGTLTLLPGERILFAFNEEYLADKQRPTLSQSFRDQLGGLITDIDPTQTHLPPFFSNLLPEGHLREYLARRAGVNAEREFALIHALGQDLPGAVTVTGAGSTRPEDTHEPAADEDEDQTALKFSLAGVQLKFSAVMETTGGLTIPAQGMGGNWIIKLPSARFEGVPENEYAMMQLARQVGIDVPEIRLIDINTIQGLPRDIDKLGTTAYAIKRFDRTDSGEAVHMEDFAQVFGVYPQEKYEKGSYRNIAEVLWTEIGETAIAEFVRRLVFNALIGNSDMHLKNWSLIYPDGRTPALAPAYDFVSTVTYLVDENMALSLVGRGTKSYASFSMDALRRFAAKARLPEHLVLIAAKETVQRFRDVWKEPSPDSLISEGFEWVIERQLKALPFVDEAD